MAQTRTGTLRFRSSSGEVVERPQEEVQSLRRAGYEPEAGQSLYIRTASGGVAPIPVERLSRVSPGTELSIPTQQDVFGDVAKERFGGAGGAALASAYGGAQGLSSGVAGKLAIESGLVQPETLGMLEAAQPVAKFAGEAVGMVGQGYALGGLGTLASGGRAAAGAAEAAGAAAKAAPTLGQAVARTAAREGAMGALYGAGSEMTQAAIEGREARPLEAAGQVGALGAVIGGAAPLAERAFGSLKGAVKSLRSQKIAESETLRAAEIAKAENKLAAARTAEEKAAAREELRKAREVEKAAAKVQQADVETKVAERIDEAAIAAGDEATTKLGEYRDKLQKDINARVNSVNDAVANLNEVETSLAQMRAGKKIPDAEANLRARLDKLVAEHEVLGADITARDGIIADTRKYGDAAEQVISLNADVSQQQKLAASGAAKAAEELKLAQTAGRRGEEIARLEENLRFAMENEKLASVYGNATNELAAGINEQRRLSSVGRDIGRDAGILGRDIAKETAREASLTSRLQRLIPDELVGPGEAAMEGKALSEALARKMGLAPALADIIPEVGAQTSAFKAGIGQVLTKASTERMLMSAARTGGEDFLRTVIELAQTGMRAPEGLALTERFIGASSSNVLNFLRENPSVIQALEPAQRSRLLPVISGIKTSGAKGAASKDQIIQALRKKSKAVALQIPEEEITAALARSQEGAQRVVAPEAAYSAQRAATRESLEAERAIAQKATASMKPVYDALVSERATVQREAADLAEKIKTQQESIASAKYEKDLAVKNQVVQSLRDQLERKQAADATLAAVEARLAGMSKAPIGEAALTQAREDAVAARNAIQVSKAQRSIDVLSTKKANVGAQIDRDKAQLKKLLGDPGEGIKGLEQMQRDALETLEGFRATFGDVGTVERNAITGKYFVPGEADMVERSMKSYFKTPEGKVLADQLAAAEKASKSKAARAVEAQAREAVAKETGIPAQAQPTIKQTLQDAITDPATIAATVTGGPAAGIGVIAAMVASRSGSGGVRKLLTSMSPMFFYTALERVATIGERMATAPIAKVATAAASGRPDTITRKDVSEANATVDDLIRQQKDADNAFKLAASSTRFPTDEYAPLETRYREAVGQLQKLRPASMGKGSPSAEEEEYTRAVRLIMDPNEMASAFERGTLTGRQAQLLKTVAPDAYKSMEHIVKTVYDERPQAVNPRTLNAFRIATRSSLSNVGFSVSEAMQTMNAGTQMQKDQQRGSSLGTRRPSSAESLGKTLAGEKQ